MTRLHRLAVKALDRFLRPRPILLDPYAGWLAGLGRDDNVKGRL